MMKHFKRWIISCGLLLAALLTAGPVFASDITMVTYFPVPYASYNNLYMQTPDPDNVTPRFTVGGKSDKEFTLNLKGQTADDGTQHPSLKVVSGAVAKLNAPCADIVNDDARNTCLAAVGSSAVNKLQFDTDILTDKATFGNTATLGAATMEFKSNLRINNQLGGDGAASDKPLQEIHATALNVDGTMNMITDSFETNAAALPGCDGTVSWNQLKFAGSDSWFLTCGYEGGSEPEDPDCPDGIYKWELASGGLTCVFKDSGTSYEAIIANTLTSGEPYATHALANGIIQQSQCITSDTTWHSGDPLYFVEYNASTLCQYHQPTGVGQTCLDILATVGENGSHFSLPYCSTNTIPPGNLDWSPSIICSGSGEITWLSGTNGDNDPQISLYKAVCAN